MEPSIDAKMRSAGFPHEAERLPRPAMQMDQFAAPTKVQIKKDVGLDALEAEIVSAGDREGPCELSISVDEKASFFREQWLAMVVAAAFRTGHTLNLIPWGHQSTPDLDDDDSWAFTLPFLLALQRGAAVTTDGKHKVPISGDIVSRNVWERRSGVLGAGGRSRRIVEFDPDSPVALAFQGGAEPNVMFRHKLRNWLKVLEIGSLPHGGSGDSGAKGELLNFLFELRANGLEHSSRSRGVRMLRLQKHLSPNREHMLAKAASFPQLAAFVYGQPPSGPVNLVEVSVSDFGPGILRSFLDSFQGLAHRNRAPEEVLHDLVHTQLSAKADPGAGLGIPNALAAARRMSAFVSLRTGNQWLVSNGDPNASSEMVSLPGDHPHIEGTHWQLIYPDPVISTAPSASRAQL